MAYTITNDAFEWEPKRPIGQERVFKVDPEAWTFKREEIKVDFANVSIFRDKGSSTRRIRVTGMTASDDRNEMLGELDAFTALRDQSGNKTCTIVAGAETYEDCYLMEVSGIIEPSADPLYHIAFELTFMQFDDGTTGTLESIA